MMATMVIKRKEQKHLAWKNKAKQKNVTEPSELPRVQGVERIKIVETKVLRHKIMRQ